MAILHPLERLVPRRNYSAKATERDDSKSLGQNEAILELCGERETSEIFPGRISSQFTVGAIDAVPIEGRLVTSSAESSVIGEDLPSAQTPKFIELSLIRLEGVLAAQ